MGIKEFTKHADNYEKLNFVQKDAAKHLLSKLPSNSYANILDLGCGSGTVYKSLPAKPKHFVGVDASEMMCKLHPYDEGMQILCMDFDSLECQRILKSLSPFDMVVASSSLQWSKNRAQLFQTISKLSDQFAFMIFTDKTFASIYECAGIESFLPSAEDIFKEIRPHYNFEYELKSYKLEFDSALATLRYIKNSGVAINDGRFGFVQTKKLMCECLNELQFEALFIWAKSSFSS